MNCLKLTLSANEKLNNEKEIDKNIIQKGDLKMMKIKSIS